MKKRITALILAFVMVLGTVAVAAGADKTITVTPMGMTINGRTVTPLKSDGTPAEVFAYDGATYVPLRYLSELLGIEVVWDKNDPDTAKLVGDKLTVPSGGAYEGTAAGRNGDIVASVTLKNNKITAIDILKHNETPTISDPAFSTIPDAIIQHQSIAVDVVAGATSTSKGIIGAVTAALQAAGVNMADFSRAPGATTSSTEHTELTADVVIVGGGGSGLAAAVAATDHGASVIVLEKRASLGGNTIVSGGIYNCPDPELLSDYEMTSNCSILIEQALAETPVSEEHAALQAAVREEYEAYVASGANSRFDSANWYALQTWNGGDKIANLALVKALAEKSLPTYRWLQSKGMAFNGKLTQGAGSLYPRTHTPTEILGTGYINTYIKDLDKKADLRTIMTNTAGKELIIEDGKVVGVQAEDSKGNTYSVYANKNVILATGGFANNIEMCQEYNTSGKWPAFTNGILSTNVSGIDGDGIRMALGAGANLVDMDQIQLMYLGNLKDGSTVGMTKRDASPEYVVFVNEQGERFVREDGRRDEICIALLKESNNIMYMIESAADYDVDTELTFNGDSYSEAVAAGDMIIADTLDELAAKIGCNADTLKASIDGYNASVDAGVDKEFGRLVLLNKIEKGPYVAVPRVVTVHHTMGGIEIDSDCHVLRADGSIIEGLLACGETTGGIHGGNRIGGNALVDMVVNGRTAGETASK